MYSIRRIVAVMVVVGGVFGGMYCLCDADAGGTGGGEGAVGVGGCIVDAAKFESLQAAVDALGQKGGLVRIGPGTYEINEPIIIEVSDATIEGVGTASHIKNVNRQGKPTIMIRHPSGQDSRKAELWRVRLANLRLTGNEASGCGIEVRRVNEVFIEGVTVSYHGGDGIRLYYCYEDPRICDSLVTYNKGIGLHLIGCHDIVVSANQFEENGQAVRCVDSYNLCMTGNNLDDHLGDGVVIENTYGSVVAANMIEECNGWAVVLGRDCYGITLSANVIAHNGGGILLKDAHGCAVSGNTFTITKDCTLRIGPMSGRVTVTGNNFSDSYIGDGRWKRDESDRAAGGMVVEGTHGVTVVGNLFSGLRPAGLSVQGEPSVGVVVSDNVFVDTAGEEQKLQGSLVRDNLKIKGR